ncbi:MAG: HD domain-containing protein [Phaeodactylibacter sp.]|nr:HD domain-containing protein [Phaeodactylibacter sp.]MCB9273226.1 HD domain-containing protein [Lewinellaceae bacterium]
MAQESIVDVVEKYVTGLLKEKLTDDHRYHSLSHTLKVHQAAVELGRAMGLSRHDMETLELATLFHDVGFSETYEGHEAVSGQLARKFLAGQNYPKEKTEKVLSLIDATYPQKIPANTLEQVIKDADLSNLASEHYLDILEGLRHEWAAFLNATYSDDEWYKLNYKFVKNHQFYTDAAKEMYGFQWDVNRRKLKELRDGHAPEAHEHNGKKDNKKEKEKKKDKEAASEAKEAGPGAITSSKSAQMMFKTALRNHLDLSSLADNKANIMLSVNALIITIAMPMAVSNIKGNLFLLFPLGTLLATCLLSMIFATLATRPIHMTGYTSKQQISEGKSNLFFFGNFYRMKYEEYEEGMQEVVADDNSLESSIMRDLYYLGHSLGNKYRQLRICYNTFMFGIILTVIIFAISYALYAI